MNLEGLINSIEEDYILEIRKSELFPYICHISSAILYDYLKRLGFNPKMVSGNIYNFGRRKKANFHTWIEVEDKVIDFVMFQFYVKKKELIELLKLNDIDLIKSIKKIQGKFIFEKAEFYEIFYKKDNFIFINPFENKNINLEKDFKDILKDYDFKSFLIRDIIPNISEII